MNNDDNTGRFEDMSDDEVQAFIEDDDDFPGDPAPEFEGEIFRDKYGIVWECVEDKSRGWIWRPIADAHDE